MIILPDGYKWARVPDGNVTIDTAIVNVNLGSGWWCYTDDMYAVQRYFDAGHLGWSLLNQVWSIDQLIFLPQTRLMRVLYACYTPYVA